MRRDESLSDDGVTALTQAQLATVVALAADAIIAVDGQHRIIFFNHGAERIFGHAAAAMLSQPLGALLPERLRSRHTRHIQDFAGVPEQARLMGGRERVIGLRSNGEEFPAEASIAKAPGNGEPVFLVVLRDVTEQRALEAQALQLAAEQAARAAAEAGERRMSLLAKASAELASSLQVAHERLQEQAQELEAQAEELAVRNAELEEQARELARLDRTRSDFMATISHELRTPLNAIIGYSDLLVEGVPVAVPESARKHAARIRLGADHLLRLIEEILTFSSLEAGRQRAIMEDLDTRCLIDELQAVIEPLAEQRGLEFRIDTGAAPATLRTDPNRLRQILLNLLANAVKFTDEGHIELEAAQEDNSAVFHVRDTGIGIRTEEQRFLFEPFWQADQTHTRRMQGAGLGLAIADRLTTLLGGSITVTSTVGEGTEFCLRVPLNCTASGNPAAAPGNPAADEA
jgi:PAS domain S-box-containing protein